MKTSRRLFAAAAIGLGTLTIAGGFSDSWAKPRPTFGRPSDCGKFDCEGGIICSCCYDNGCYICDAQQTGPHSTYEPVYLSCTWEPKGSTIRGGLSKVPGAKMLTPSGPPPNP
jgi:hypothetical protein